LELDHVLIAVADLDAAARELEARHGLASVEGGRHPGSGTANRIVPLGDTYLELIAVVDRTEAAASAFGRWVADARPGPLGWAVRTRDLDGVARQRDLAVNAGSRATPTGEVLRWRSAGIAEAAAEPPLPFFLEWAEGAPFPGRDPATSARIDRLELRGNADRLADWLGAHDLPIVVRPGQPALQAVVLTSGAVVD
jgi:glyoxalase-like protein